MLLLVKALVKVTVNMSLQNPRTPYTIRFEVEVENQKVSTVHNSLKLKLETKKSEIVLQFQNVLNIHNSTHSFQTKIIMVSHSGITVAILEGDSMIISNVGMKSTDDIITTEVKELNGNLYSLHKVVELPGVPHPICPLATKIANYKRTTPPNQNRKGIFKLSAQSLQTGQALDANELANAIPDWF
jgi:hypothetical protein